MKKIYLNLILIIVLCSLYEFLHIKLDINSTILPSISDIIQSFKVNWYSLLINMSYTLFETIIGLIIAIILSMILSFLINENKYFKKYVLKIIYIFQMIPLVAISPLLIIWLGYGIKSKIILIVLYSTFVIVINLIQSFENISFSHKLYIQSLTKSKIKLYENLYFPLSYEQFFAGVKVATTYGLVCAITSEYLGAKHGIGLLLNRAYSSYQTDLVFCILILIVISTFIMLKVVQIIEWRIRR